MTSDFDRFVFVALPGRSDYVVAGRFRVSTGSDGARTGEFVYGRSYLSRADAVEIDPVDLRLTRRVCKTRSFNGVFGSLRDSMLTSWGRVISTGNDAGGALAFAPGPEPPAPKLRFLAVDDLSRLLGTDPAATTTQQDPMGHQPVRGGAKAVVKEHHTLWVAKLPEDEMGWNQARVRDATQQLARECGLATVPSRIENIQGTDILMLQRLDRVWVGDGYACARVLSGLTLLRTEDTTAARQRWSYLTLADEVRRVSSHPREDLRQLFGRMCFNAAISNPFDDLRYTSMIAHGTGWRLLPCTSLAPTPLPDGKHGDFAMICGPLGRSPSRDNIVAGAGRFLLDRGTAEAIFDRTFEVIRSSWYDVMRRSGVSVRDRELLRPSMARSSAAHRGASG